MKDQAATLLLDIQKLVMENVEVIQLMDRVMQDMDNRIKELEGQLPVEEIFKGTLKTLEDL